MITESTMTFFHTQNLSQQFSRSSFHLRLDELQLEAGSITGVVGENGKNHIFRYRSRGV
jgi:ABC-type sugar transport system ATPase subunit